ncbi:hypothetical protein ETAA1_28450 [Urbifossiella limnaea]|uniref:Uncharacterized protein n=1 Tax=Urbifossiella limnaea TaxID=2528023 RepID=A0A517XTQ7_9BACT|nr:hypothetical protein ETAA1_28450 [Urbifossiella limnaea]
MVAEAADAVPEAKPDDLPYDGRLPLPRFGGPNGFFAISLGNGSVRFIGVKPDEAAVRAAVTRDGGEVLTFPPGDSQPFHGNDDFFPVPRRGPTGAGVAGSGGGNSTRPK